MAMSIDILKIRRILEDDGSLYYCYRMETKMSGMILAMGLTFLL